MSKRFKHLYIEITDACNLNCEFCPYNRYDKHTFMTKEVFVKILDQVAPVTDYLYLHVKGEPLLHPELFNFIEEAKQRNLKINITTNGTLLNSVAQQLFLQTNINKINISLQALLNLNDSDREDYLNNLIAFLKKHQENPRFAINLRFWNNENKTEVKELNNHIIQRIKEQFLVNGFQDKSLIMPKVFYSKEDEFRWPDLNDDINPIETKCLGGKTHLAILVDGTVTICCLDEKGSNNLGNIIHDSLSTILSSPLYNELMMEFRNNKSISPLCKRCTYRLRFKNKQ